MKPPTLYLSPIGRKFFMVNVTATMPDRSLAELTSVDVALLPVRARPTLETTWYDTSYAGRYATFLGIGPQAERVENGLVVPGSGASTWIRVLDEPEVLLAMVGLILIQ